VTDPKTSGADSLVIRPMIAGDGEAVARLAREMALALAEPDPMLAAKDLRETGFGAEPWFEGFVAETDGAVIGYVMACRRYEAHMGKRRLWIADLYVEARARRSGAGRALMRAIAARAAALGCDRLCWDLWTRNDRARAFYEALGARIDEELWVMTLPVGKAP